jgi:1-pyrroline-5-carboxylate dehydrogenase
VQPAEYENELTYHTHQLNGTEEEFHSVYEDAVESVKSELGAYHALRIDGESVDNDDQFTVQAPGNLDLTIGEFAAGGEAEVDAAVNATKNAQPDWEHQGESERAEVFTNAAQLLRERKFEFAATLSLENGKNRTEAIADIEKRSTSSNSTAGN